MRKKPFFRILAWLLALTIPALTCAEKEGETLRDPHRVFYEIFVSSFSDSDGDGTGDLRGILRRMDYLNDGDPASEASLGVGGLWLTPIFESPSYHKYDVADYGQIDPAFGTEADLKELLDVCHSRDVTVILDLALNHTSTQHPWYQHFLEAHLSGDMASDWYDWYVWLPAGEKAPAGRRFTQVQEAGIQVEANFSDSMPELNLDHPPVRQAALEIARYWLELGADGFRFDAAKYLYLGEHEKNIAFWTWYIGELKRIRPDVYTVAEVWDGEGITNRYASCVNCFHFSASQAEGVYAEAAKAGDVNRLTAATERYLETLQAINPDAMDIPFLSNHDMDRSAGYLTMASGRAQMAATLYLWTPGSPFLYYGEEIGLRGSRGGANTDANRRLAMLWGDGDPVQDPPGSTYDKQSPYSVQDLEAMGTSLLRYYRRALRIRRQYPAIARGSYTALKIEGSKAGGFICALDGEETLVLHNTTDREAKIDLLEVTGRSWETLREVLGVIPDESGASLEGDLLTLGPQTSVVIE